MKPSAEPRRKNGFNDNGLVMGQVTILRRGESLNSVTFKTKGGDSESTSPNQKPVEDLTVCIIAEEEMARREKQRDLAIFERLHGNPAKSSANIAVKKFCRTITARDVKAYYVRHVSVLEDTLNYLRNLLNSSEGSFEVIHDFIFDRTRCIRQDLSVQNSMGDQVIHMYERMDMSQQPPWQKLVASDLHGNQWNFCHIFRGCQIFVLKFRSFKDYRNWRRVSGTIKNQYYNQSQYNEVKSEWSEFVYSYVGA